jgi:hypothetical protein
MSTGYAIPMCPGDDPGADWQQMGWCCRECAAMAHVAWCPNHDPDEPVPFTLTPKALAFLGRTAPGRHEGTAIIDGPDGWACGRCGFAWFGPVPDDGLCRNCRDSS